MDTQQQQEHVFKFTGDGWEYFGIWIVNLLLTIATLGIYSAWAKVRRLQYFYRNTQLADAGFDYHGTPIAILKGRLIAGALFLLYYAAGQANPFAALAIMLLIGLAMPWLIVRSLRFKLYNSSYRGLRFAFAGGNKDAYTTFLLFPVLTMATFNLLAPLTHQRIKQYQHRNSRFGATSFDFDASAGSFYGIYLKSAGIMIALVAVLAPGPAFLPELVPPFFMVTGLLVMAYWTASLFNLIWNSTTLGEHRFVSRMKVSGYMWLGFTNLLGILFTLGLFIPFAEVRMLRYKLENMKLLAQGNLEDFVAGQEQQAGAAGQEIAEMFDLDISL